MDKKDITKKYTNGEVTIVWKPSLCIHSTNCWNKETGLSEVFKPREKPWIQPEGVSTEKIIAQIKKCPSGALSFYMNEEKIETPSEQIPQIIKTMPNGPLMVYGSIIVQDHEGNETQKNNVTAFCRCGGSNNKPYCDGTHKKIGFEG